MCEKRLLTGFRTSLAIAAMAICLVGGATPPAAARVLAATQPSWARGEHARIHRNLKYAPIQPGPTYELGGQSGYCEPLSGASCEGYDVN
jgi:hypothetical protein